MAKKAKTTDRTDVATNEIRWEPIKFEFDLNSKQFSFEYKRPVLVDIESTLSAAQHVCMRSRIAFDDEDTLKGEKPTKAAAKSKASFARS